MTSLLDTKESQEKFLEQFVEAHGDSRVAREASGIARKVFFRWLEDREFRDRFDQYRILLSEDLENEAVRRIMGSKGAGGKGTDLLLMKTLAGLKPERYRDQPTGNDNRTVIYVSNVRTVPRPGIAEGENANSPDLPNLEHHQDDSVHLEGDQDGGVTGAGAQGDGAGTTDSSDSDFPAKSRPTIDITEPRALYRAVKERQRLAEARPGIDPDADTNDEGRSGRTHQPRD